MTTSKKCFSSAYGILMGFLFAYILYLRIIDNSLEYIYFWILSFVLIPLSIIRLAYIHGKIKNDINVISFLFLVIYFLYLIRLVNNNYFREIEIYEFIRCITFSESVISAMFLFLRVKI